MEDKEKLKGYIELYKAQLERFDKRRDIEWKVTLGLWVGIFIFTGFALNNLQIVYFDLWIYAVVWLLFILGITRGTWIANETDKAHANVYRNRIEVLIGYKEDNLELEKPPAWGFITNYARLFQIATTAILLLASWYFLFKSPIEQVCCCP